MITLRHFPLISPRRLDSVYNPTRPSNTVACAMKGPRTRYPRVWKSKTRVGTISKSNKLVNTIKGLSNVKEEVYGALDSFIAWELEFPLIVVKKALDTLEKEKEWKRIIQVTKWMLSKGQGKTMGSYFTLLNALAQDGRLEEAEELWTKLFSENLEKVPRVFFDKIISIYYNRNMHEKMFEVFADMEELGVQPNSSIVKMMGNVFQKLDMLDKYEKLNKKYPPLAWEYRYIKGKRVKIKTKNLKKVDDEESNEHSNELIEDSGEYLSESDEEGDKQSSEVEEEPRIANEFDEATKSTNELKKVGDEEANKHSNELKEDSLSESDEESNKQHLSDVEEELTIPKGKF